MKKTKVHLHPREEVKRGKGPTDMLMSTACLDVYDSLTIPQKIYTRVKHLFRARDSYIDEL